jgi:hypothetical protein
LSTWTTHRARVASLTRSRTPDDPDLIAARRNLAAARLEDYVQRVVDAAPPLTPEQRDRIAAILAPSAEVPSAVRADPWDADAAPLGTSRGGAGA